jgi:uncharacterized protein YjbJ (UPF0337 family)
MNKTILQGKWRRVRGNLKTEWGRLTDNDRQQLDGKLDQMVGLFQERYGYTRGRAAHLLTRYLGEYGRRRRSRVPGQAQLWLPALSVLGMVGLMATGWFFFSRFLTEATEFTPEGTPAEEFITSPETELV